MDRTRFPGPREMTKWAPSMAEMSPIDAIHQVCLPVPENSSSSVNPKLLASINEVWDSMNWIKKR